MTRERQIQAEDHRTKTERLIKSDLGHDNNAAASSGGGNCVAAAGRTREAPSDRPRVTLQCAA
jgi:hypothetical protein